ncbi:MAG TPA: sulfur carrier protein ThiS [Gemmatimonadaceae bacterium]|nr:sulfur carrier protein ThiS [Gemmatimonadaceae bacterium]
MRPRAEITLTVNGDERRLPAGASLGDLLRAHALDPRMVVVEHNRTILRDRSAFDALPLGDGDTVEIVHFVGGG